DIAPLSLAILIVVIGAGYCYRMAQTAYPFGYALSSHEFGAMTRQAPAAHAIIRACNFNAKASMVCI
ncbi:MAG: hypothetical protein JL56_17420, partial [Desulfotomaculum sp. BICA1-6]